MKSVACSEFVKFEKVGVDGGLLGVGGGDQTRGFKERCHGMWKMICPYVTCSVPIWGPSASFQFMGFGHKTEQDGPTTCWSQHGTETKSNSIECHSFTSCFHFHLAGVPRTVLNIFLKYFMAETSNALLPCLFSWWWLSRGGELAPASWLCPWPSLPSSLLSGSVCARPSQWGTVSLNAFGMSPTHAMAPCHLMTSTIQHSTRMMMTISVFINWGLHIALHTIRVKSGQKWTTQKGVRS